MPKDYYHILGVKKDASEDEIKKAFRRLAHDHHPDKGGDAAKFKDINEAYQVLGDKTKRTTYDRFGSAAFDGQGAGGPGPGGFGGGFGFDPSQGFQGGDMGDLGDILGEMFGFGGVGGGHARTSRGQNVEIQIDLTFREAVFGVEREIRLKKLMTCEACAGSGAENGSKIVTCDTCHGNGQVRQTQRVLFGVFETNVPCTRCHGRGKIPEKTCHTCSGSGVTRREQTMKISIPAGVSEGEVLRVNGAGEAAPFGAAAGDLFVHLRVKSDAAFTRSGHDIQSRVEVVFSILALGGTIQVPTLDGLSDLQIPAGTAQDSTFVLRGKGVPSSRKRGDHIVKIAVVVPKKLSKEQKSLLEQLREQEL